MNLTHPNESTLGEIRTRLKGIDRYRKSLPPNSSRVHPNCAPRYSKSTTKEFDLDLGEHHSKEPT